MSKVQDITSLPKKNVFSKIPVKKIAIVGSIAAGVVLLAKTALSTSSNEETLV